MSRIYVCIFLVFICLLTISCSLQDHPKPPASPDIYISGTSRKGNIYSANYWKNGQLVKLTEGEGARSANGIIVDNNDVHVVGYGVDDNGKSTGMYWKNQQLVSFPSNPVTPVVLNGVVVSGGEVYLTGAGRDTTKPGNLPVYWKNGVPVVLNDQAGGVGKTIKAIGNDVHVAGSTQSLLTTTATYWKNGAEKMLDFEGLTSTANGIAISGSDVYIAGFSDNRTRIFPRYWKNGVPYELNTVNKTYASEATAICISENDVYIAGRETSDDANKRAKYWKNGQAVFLPGGDTTTGIAVMNNNVYVSGYYYDGKHYIAVYWKNGVRTVLSDGTSDYFATAISINP